MNTHIVTEPSALMRKIARDALRNHWKEMFLAMAIYTVLTSYVQAVLDLIFANYQTLNLYGYDLNYNTSFVGGLYEVILTGAFMYGLALFMLTFFRTKRIDNKLLFEGFSMLGKTILLQIVITVFVFLWSLLFIIPGIIAAIRYSMSFFILADHPEYTVSQCINESKARMKGNCGKYFLMLLSFIGWAIVAQLAQGFILAPFSGTFGLVIGNLLGLVPMVFLYVYIKTTETVFYELLTQNLVVMVPDQHVRAQGVDPGNMVNANYEIHEETETVKHEAEAPSDGIMDKVSDIADGAADVVSDAADKMAEFENTVADKVDDIIPDNIEDKIDDLSDNSEKIADGAPDVPQQVYEVKEYIDEEVSETVEPKDDQNDL